MARLMSMMVDLFGTDGLEAVLREVGEDSRAMLAPNAIAGTQAQVEGFSRDLRAHLGTVQVTEDDDRFTITQDPGNWSSGPKRSADARNAGGPDHPRRGSHRSRQLAHRRHHCPCYAAGSSAHRGPRQALRLIGRPAYRNPGLVCTQPTWYTVSRRALWWQQSS